MFKSIENYKNISDFKIRKKFCWCHVVVSPYALLYQRQIKQNEMSDRIYRTLFLTGVNKCKSNPCVSETQQCFNLPNSRFSCLCPDGAVLEDKKCQFRRSQCEGYCQNGGTCVVHQGTKLNSKECM